MSQDTRQTHLQTCAVNVKPIDDLPTKKNLPFAKSLPSAKSLSTILAKFLVIDKHLIDENLSNSIKIYQI